MTRLKELPNIFKSETIKPSFKEVHVLLALMVFGEQIKGIGRYKLKKELVLTEGKVKSLLSRMKKMDLIKSDSRISGHVITDNGREMLEELLQKLSIPKVPTFDFKRISVGNYAYYTVVFNAIGKIKTGMEQRDEVIKIGGTGATCLIYTKHGFEFPKSQSSDDTNEILDYIVVDLDESKIKIGDILIVGTGDNEYISKLATLSAALTLVKI